MKIAINCLGVDGGGGKTYLEHFLPELETVSNNSQYFVFVRKALVHELPPAGKTLTVVPVSFTHGNLNRILKEQFWIPGWLKENKIDLLFSPADSTALLAPCPVVLAMRNLNLYVERDRGWSLPFELKFKALSIFARLSAGKARRIIFVSKTSGRLIADKLKIATEKRRVIYHGLSPRFLKRDENVPSEWKKLFEKKPYVLAVSSIYRYKNFLRLIDAFSKAPGVSKAHHLIIAGKAVDEPYLLQMKRLIREKGLESRVHLAGEVPYSVLPSLYQQARLFVFPSYLETFGHPLVEAMASGVPVVAADIENSREITDGAALFFPPNNTDALAAQLTIGLENESTRRSLVEKGIERVKVFSWKRCAEETAAVFQDALS